MTAPLAFLLGLVFFLAGCGSTAGSDVAHTDQPTSTTDEVESWPLVAVLMSEYRDDDGERLQADRTLIVGRSWEDWVTVELPDPDGELPRPGVGSQVVRWNGEITSFAYLRDRALDVGGRQSELEADLQALPDEVDWVDRRPLPEDGERQAPTGHFVSLWGEEPTSERPGGWESSSLSEDRTLSPAVESLGLEEERITVVHVDGPEEAGLSGMIALSEPGRIPLVADFEAPGDYQEKFWVDTTFDLSVDELLEAFDEVLDDVEIDDSP